MVYVSLYLLRLSGFRRFLTFNAIFARFLALTKADHPHNSKPNPASAAALLKQALAATSAAGALDADANGSDATNFLISGEGKTKRL